MVSTPLVLQPSLDFSVELMGQLYWEMSSVNLSNVPLLLKELELLSDPYVLSLFHLNTIPASSSQGCETQVGHLVGYCHQSVSSPDVASLKSLF